ncbi:hypothetical protein DV735_g5957, partial [Chaetothyriales sp. CBS 134920]
MATPDSMNLGLKTSLRSAVRQKFASARRSGDLVFSETQLAILHTRDGVPFQLRYCPALSKKPKQKAVAGVPVSERNEKADEKADEKAKARTRAKDPFDNPSPELLISETATGSHILLLNKFPVIPNHFILATKTNKPQTHLLEPDDLAVSYACLRAWREESRSGGGGDAGDGTPGPEDDGQLLAFFNSGEHSGASQPHRHIQFVPVSDMRINHTTKWQHPDTFDWNPLPQSMKSHSHASFTINYTSNILLPLRHFAMPLRDETPASLHSKYIVLLKLALVSTGNPRGIFFNYDKDAKIEDKGEVTFSYNLVMMPDILVICPRRVESAPIPGLDSAAHSVSVNGTILAGTLMVKEQQEWDALRSREGALDDILETIGFPFGGDSSASNSTRL